MEFIRNRINEIHSEILKLNTELKEIQNICPHTNANSYNKADVGNWCTADDRYWTEYICTDCGKQWVEDQ